MRDFPSDAGFPQEPKQATLHRSGAPHWPGQTSCLHPSYAFDDVASAASLLREQLERRFVAGVRRKRNDVDIYTIIFLALAVFIFLRLRNVLGQRTGNERPPYDRAARNVVQGAQDNNVVPMPGAVIDQKPVAPPAAVAPPTDRWKGIAEPGTALAQGLDGIAARDSSFDPRHFLSGARSAYEMIVLAFANGDRRALRDLLSSEVSESFDAAIRDREKQEQKTETRFVSIDKAEKAI